MRSLLRFPFSDRLSEKVSGKQIHLCPFGVKSGAKSPGPVTCLPEPLEAQNVLHLQHASRVLLDVRLSVRRAFVFAPRCHQSQRFPVLNLLGSLR